MKQRRIVVTGNCQTGGIAAALALMLPNDKIIPHALVRSRGGPGQALLRSHLKEADVWLTSADKTNQEAISGGLAQYVVKMPAILFSAYHPDITYVTRAGSAIGSALTGPYGTSYASAIAYWAQRRGLSIEGTKRLFTREVFERLGYLDRWAADVKLLGSKFEAAGLDFADFFLRIRGPEPFMHTVNHPKVAVLAQLARQLAMQLGATRTHVDVPIERVLTDGLAEVSIWPIYPGIAEAFSAHGSYLWKIGERTYLTSLEQFLTASFAAYANVTHADYNSAAVDAYDSTLAKFV